VFLGGRQVDICGPLHAECFVRALGVEFLDKLVEALLLLEQVVACRSRRLGFESAVHALMAAILLRVSWPNPLERDAKPEPVSRELG
jgi:hypothetical protein